MKIKLLNDSALVPVKANPTDVGYDIYCTRTVVGKLLTCYTGISITPPKGYYFEVVPRSSISKHGLMLANSVGIIDPGYTGEVILKFQIVSSSPKYYLPGERIGQLILRKMYDFEFEEVDELPSSERGDGGFGSSGTK